MIGIRYAETSVSRRCSTETIYSIQGKETDYVRDTTDTDASVFDSDIEYEPATDVDDDKAPVDEDTSASFTDGEIIKTKVLEVSVGDDGDLQFADSEQTESHESDSEIDLIDFWNCAKCRAENNNPFYRYCQKCFQVRKSFFPPRPKRKRKRGKTTDVPRTLSQDSGLGSIHSQELFTSQDIQDAGEGPSSQDIPPGRKRRALSIDHEPKKPKTVSDSDSDDVTTLTKTVSDPSVSIDTPKLTKKLISERLKSDLCIICINEPKTGVFVHGHIAHICCCYKCAVKVWAKAKRCPVCNCKVSNVLRAVIM